jgi:hypothetical protein
MTDPNLVSLSLSAFAAVLLLLVSLLALVIRSARPRLPRAPAGDDAALVAALHAAVSQQQPGLPHHRIEETQAGSGS